MSRLAWQSVSSLLAAALVGSAAPPTAKVVENVQIALRVLHLRRPDVEWRQPGLRGNFTDHDAPDLAVVGVAPDRVVVVVIVGPVNGGSEMHISSWGNIAAECIRDVHLEVEELDIPEDFDAHLAVEANAERSRGVKGLKLTMPPCDTYHLYWDRPPKISWWR